MRRIVLVTGAGASHALGRDKKPLPLMPEWSRRLSAAMDAHETGLSNALGLKTDSGPEFEQNLGAFLAWANDLPLVERFLPLGADRAAN